MPRSALRLTAATLLLILGLLIPPLAWRTWAMIERALRAGEPLPGSHVALPVVIGTSAVAALLIIGILTG